MSKLNKYEAWNEFAQVDENGISRVVSAAEIKEQYTKNTKYGLLWWSKEGPTRHGRFRDMIKYDWNFIRKGNTIISIQSIGINKDEIRAELKKNRPIRKDIREWHFANFKHCCLCCEPLESFKNKSKIVIDHKDDSYSDPRVCGKAAIDTQKKEDFQIICEGCNRRKDLYKQKYPEWRPPPGHYLQMGLGNYFIDAKGVKREYWYDGEAYRKYWKTRPSLAEAKALYKSLKAEKKQLSAKNKKATSIPVIRNKQLLKEAKKQYKALKRYSEALEEQEIEENLSEIENIFGDSDSSSDDEEEAEQVANAIQMAIIVNHYELNHGAATDEELVHSLGSYTLDNKPSNKKM